MGRQGCWRPQGEGIGKVSEIKNQVAGSACSGRRAPAPRTSSAWIAACVLFVCMPIEAGRTSSNSLGFSPPFASSSPRSSTGFVLNVRNPWSAIKAPREDAAGAGGKQIGSTTYIVGRRLRAGGRIGSMPLNSMERNTVVEEAAANPPPPPSSAQKQFGSSLAERRKKSAPIARGIGLRLVLLVRFLLGSPRHSLFSGHPFSTRRNDSLGVAHVYIFPNSVNPPRVLATCEKKTNLAILLAPSPFLCILQSDDPPRPLAFIFSGQALQWKGHSSPHDLPKVQDCAHFCRRSFARR